MRETSRRAALRPIGEAGVARESPVIRRGRLHRSPSEAHLVRNEDVRYLDLDDDGVVDAVETIETVCEEGGCTPSRLVVVRTLQAEIDDSGTPHRVLGTTSCA